MKPPTVRSRLNTESLWILNNKNCGLDQIKIIVLGDSHLNTTGWNEEEGYYCLDENGRRYKKILNHIIKNHRDALFVIHGGDLIGEGKFGRADEKRQNMEAFLFETKRLLFKENMPIFASIGNQEFIQERSTRLYEQYIGNLFNDIYIPETKIHFLILPTYFWARLKPPYFDDQDLARMRKTVLQNRQIYYLIDFHAPLKVGKLINQNDTLSDHDTKKFLQQMSPNVIGILNHHIHEGYQFNIDIAKDEGSCRIPYIVTGDGGNKQSPFWSNYYIIHINNKNINNPAITDITAVRVAGL